MALELSARWWQLAFGLGLATPSRRRTIAAGDEEGLRREIVAALQRFDLSAATPVRSCYEAGRDGFWDGQQLLERLGVINVVVDSASIEVSRRARRAKTDRLDAEALLRRLIRSWLGERDQVEYVHVPSMEVEDARHAERTLAMLTAERTRARNRLHGLLATQGLRIRLTPQFGAADPDAEPSLPPGVVARLRVTWRLLQGIEQERREARQAQAMQVQAGVTPAAVRTQRLRQLRGIQVGSAAVLAKEVFARDLRNRREVGALSGLVPVPYQSGDAGHDQGISRAGYESRPTDSGGTGVELGAVATRQ